MNTGITSLRKLTWPMTGAVVGAVVATAVVVGAVAGAASVLASQNATSITARQAKADGRIRLMITALTAARAAPARGEAFPIGTVAWPASSHPPTSPPRQPPPPPPA